jgi:hypothetical protein
VRLHRPLAEVVEPAFLARHFGHGQRAARVRDAVARAEVVDAEPRREVAHVRLHAAQSLRREELVEPHAAGGRLRMQLEAAPVQREVVFTEQPDQTASLRDVTERSDEIGVEAKGHRHED